MREFSKLRKLRKISRGKILKLFRTLLTTILNCVLRILGLQSDVHELEDKERHQ